MSNLFNILIPSLRFLTVSSIRSILLTFTWLLFLRTTPISESALDNLCFDKEILLRSIIFIILMRLLVSILSPRIDDVINIYTFSF